MNENQNNPTENVEQPAAVQQMEELNLPDDKRAIRCSDCGNAVVVDKKTGVEQLMARRDSALPGIVDVGFQCPICKKWYHSFYTSKSLDSLRRESEMEHHPRRRSALRGKYSRKFARFQEEIKKRLAGVSQ